MPEAKPPVVLPILEGMDITLESVEFENDYEGDDERPHRTIFVFRLHLGEAGVYREFPVTMCEPYENFDALHRMAWTELYLLLRQFAELSRRKADVPEIAFEPPE